MRRALLPPAVALAMVLTLFVAAPAEAQSKCFERWPDRGISLAGRVNGRAIEAHVDRGQGHTIEENVIEGLFFYPDTWRPGTGDAGLFSLDGKFTADCELNLTESAASQTESAAAVWRLRFAEGRRRLVGTRTDAGTPASVELRVVPETDCSGRGPWRTFSSPNWPITFQYPASWRIAEDGNEITIQCPSAIELTMGGFPITLKLGRGRESSKGEDGRESARIGAFVTFGRDEWLSGDTCEDREPGDPGILCSPARKSAWRGMTVLQGRCCEHRLYRPGSGYIGQGPGIISYLFMFGDRWVELTSREGPAVLSRLLTPGPVIFEGNGLTERLVRSIKPVVAPAQ